MYLHCRFYLQTGSDINFHCRFYLKTGSDINFYCRFYLKTDSDVHAPLYKTNRRPHTSIPPTPTNSHICWATRNLHFGVELVSKLFSGLHVPWVKETPSLRFF